MTKEQTRIFNDECKRILHAQADVTRYELLKDNYHIFQGFSSIVIEISSVYHQPISQDPKIPDIFFPLFHSKLLTSYEIESLCNFSLSHRRDSASELTNLINWQTRCNNSAWLIRQLTTVCFEQAESSFQIIKKEIDAINTINEKIKCCEKVKKQWWRLPSTKKFAQEQIQNLSNELFSYSDLETLRENALKPLHMLQNLANFTFAFLQQQEERLRNAQNTNSQDSSNILTLSEHERTRKTTGSFDFRTLFTPIIVAKTSNAICCAMHNSIRKTFIRKGIINDDFPKLAKAKIENQNIPDCAFSASECSTICKTIMERKSEIRNENERATSFQRIRMRQEGLHLQTFSPHFESSLEFPIFPFHSFVERKRFPQYSMGSLTQEYNSNLQRLNEEHTQQIRPTLMQRLMCFFTKS